LPGRGRPLALEDDSHLPPDLRLACKVLRNAGYVPEEAVADEKNASLSDLLAHCPDEREKLHGLRRLDVMLARAGQRRGRAVAMPDNAYHAKLAERCKTFSR